jgi:hypothetical protein
MKVLFIAGCYRTPPAASIYNLEGLQPVDIGSTSQPGLGA